MQAEGTRRSLRIRRMANPVPTTTTTIPTKPAKRRGRPQKRGLGRPKKVSGSLAGVSKSPEEHLGKNEELAQGKSENESQAELIAELEEISESLRRERDRLEKRLKRNAQRELRLELQRNEAEDARKKCEEKIVSQQMDVNNMKMTLKAMSDRNAHLEQEIKSWMWKNENLQTVIDSEHSVNKVQKELAARKEEALRQELEVAKEQVSKLETSVASLQMDLDEMNEKWVEAERNAAKTENEGTQKDELQTKLVELSSISVEELKRRNAKNNLSSHAKLDLIKHQFDTVKDKRIDKNEMQKFIDALKNFKEPKEDELIASEEKSGKFRLHPNKDVEEYFAASARWGVPAISWDIVRPVFLWKLKFVLSEFMNFEETKPDANNIPSVAKKETKNLNVSTNEKTLWKAEPVPFDINVARDLILEKVNEYEGFPFTWQRLCELLTTPKQHYNKCDKFMRAIDKVINVVTPINEWGRRITGEWKKSQEKMKKITGEWTEPTTDPVNMKIESYFFGKVEPESMDTEAVVEPKMEPTDVLKKESEETNEKNEEKICNYYF